MGERVGVQFLPEGDRGRRERNAGRSRQRQFLPLVTLGLLALAWLPAGARAEASSASGASLPEASHPGPAAKRAADWLELFNTHTNETLRVTFRNAQGFIPEALAELDRLLGDHRAREHRRMDSALFVLLADLAAAAGVEPRYEVISGYRSARTNEKLRANGGGQAKQSQHIEGKAIDVRLEGVQTSRLRDLARALGRGGVGYYPKSDFVHVDTARVRYWEG